MRVLFLTHAYPRDDADPVGSFILRLALALREHGVEVRVLAPSAPGLAAEEALHGIPVRRFRYATAKLETLAYTGTMSAQVRDSWGARIAMAGLLTAAGRRMAAELRSFRPDVVHAHWWFPSGLVASAFRRLWGTPLVTTLHGSDLRVARSVPGGGALFRGVAGASDVLTTVSRWLAAEARQLAPRVEAVVAPMPVAPDLFFPPSARARDRLLFVGKLTEQKGLHHLLRALSLMTARPRLDVVGAGRVDDRHLRELAVELGVADGITWHPLLRQAELAELYRAATAHVIPAIDEGLGLTAVESLLCETPVVAFESGGVVDAVLHERTGILVPPGDHVALARELDELLARDDQGASLGREGRRYALETFGGDAVARRYADVYARAAAGRRALTAR